LKLRDGPKKTAQSLLYHIFATIHHTAKCSERNCLLEKGRCLNKAIKYSLFCCLQVSSLKTILTATSLRQVRNINKLIVQSPNRNGAQCVHSKNEHHMIVVFAPVGSMSED